VIAVENEAKRVAAIKAGLSAVGAEPGTAPSAANPAPTKAAMPAPPMKPSPVDEVVMKDRFVNKGFQFYFVKGKETVLFYFRRNGDAVRKITRDDGTSSFQVGDWKIEEDGSVDVTDIASPKWFWFGEDGSCQMVQGAKEGTTQVLTLVPDAEDPEK
jgi:hypothetical protein